MGNPAICRICRGVSPFTCTEYVAHGDGDYGARHPLSLRTPACKAELQADILMSKHMVPC
jgi:hypothetical protein